MLPFEYALTMSNPNEDLPKDESLSESQRLLVAREIGLRFLREDILDPTVVRDMPEAAERAEALQQAGQRDDYNGIDYGVRPQADQPPEDLQ
jgi:hypothetical protein